MKLFKGILIFIVAFLFACILIFTFTQEPFKQLVPARVLTWRTPSIPIYAYVAGAFGIGLIIGLITTLYYYIVQQSKLHQRTRELREVEEQLADARRELDQYGLSQRVEDVVPAPSGQLLPEEVQDTPQSTAGPV
jgi:uncharacterized membrane protein YciS (DUF1049 family)